MASGVKVHDRVKDVYNAMKVVKNDDIETERMRLVVLKIETDVIVEKVYQQKDVEGKDVFAFFTDLLRNDFKEACRYFLYDCHYKNKDSGDKEDLIFVMWAPDKAKCKERLIYSSSKAALTKIIDGVKHTLQINDLSDFDKNSMMEKLGKGVLSLEGVSCSCDEKGH